MMPTIYFDHSASSYPKPEEVYRFMDRAFRDFGVNPGRAGYRLCREAGDLVDETRAEVAAFFGAPAPERLVFSQNSTDALNLALFGLLDKGDHAVSTTLEHNSVLRPLFHLARSRGVEADYVPFDESGLVDPEAIAGRFKPTTKLVVMVHGSNVVGTVQRAAEVGRLCRERGVLLVLDASQTAGAITVDVGALAADVLCFTGHKSMMGPTGIGGMYVREGVEIRHTRAGGTGVRAIERAHLEDYPHRMEYGTPNLLGIAGLKAGVSWLRAQGLAELHAREMALAAKLCDGLRAIDGVTLYCQDGRAERLAIVLCNVDGLEAGDVGTILDSSFQIAVRTGLHCAPLAHQQLGTAGRGGAVRFSIGPFNTDSHIQAAVDAMSEIAEQQRRRTRLDPL
jgi:cysteine desulfurase/selenocysteine lyase